METTLLDQLEALRARGIWLFGVRHHSPACAHHVRRLIRRLSPKSVVIEGPPELERLVPLMLSPEARPPFAAYCAVEANGDRRAGYYPFASASPERVAVEEGTRAGARIRFADLGFGVPRGSGGKRSRRRLTSLLEEAHLARSAYLEALAKKTGCRDHDELWDHLFEGRSPDEPTEGFIRDVAVYCALARRGYDRTLLEADGSLRRERAMTLGVRREVADQGPGARVLVVTGGFHTPQIAAWLMSEAPLEAPPEGVSQPVLIRYGAKQLDALNGYGAGMPAPAYQDALAAAYERGGESPQLEAAGAMVVEVARLARAEGAFAANAAQAVDALSHAQRLANLRGRVAVTRSDVADSLLSTLGKGPADAEGALVRALVARVFTGARVGSVPRDAGVPPIIEDFRARIATLKLEAGPTTREVALSLYQRETHRAGSRFLHALRFLGVPYARWVAGPDFVAGLDTHRRRETWQLRWSPDVDAALLDASSYGASVATAAAGRLEEETRGLAEAGRARDAVSAVALLVQGLAMGVSEALGELVPVVAAHLRQDSRVERVVDGLVSLVLSLEGRDPLQAFGNEVVVELAEVAFERVLRGLGELARVPVAREDDVTRALASTRHLAASSALEGLAPRLGDALAAAAAGDRTGVGSPRIQGALTGLAHGFGRLEPEALARRIRGHLMGTGDDPARKVAFLGGVLETAREVAWREPAVTEGVHHLFESWDQATFMRALPALRLAFSRLTPREIDRVAAAIPGLSAEEDPASHEVVDPDIERRVRTALGADGLDAWGEA